MPSRKQQKKEKSKKGKGKKALSAPSVASGADLTVTKRIDRIRAAFAKSKPVHGPRVAGETRSDFQNLQDFTNLFTDFHNRVDSKR